MVGARGGGGRGRPGSFGDVVIEVGEVVRRWRDGEWWWQPKELVGSLVRLQMGGAGVGVATVKGGRGVAPFYRAGGGVSGR
jgi:hypothetical protein